jgi:HD-GYP domain-containing protein (c-di-GMP phosphodiesterase class II)
MLGRRNQFGLRGVTRPLCALIVLQGACLAAGLWIHDRFLVSAARWNPARPTVSESGTTGDGGPNPMFDAMPAARAIAFAWTFGLQSVLAYLLLARMQWEHSRQQSRSDKLSQQNARDLLRTRDAVIFGLAKLAESRDPDTGHHLERISLYSTRLAAAAARHPRYRNVVTPSFVRLIGISSALHDIGKVAIEDSVLLKPGELTSAERFRMQLHAEVGADSIREIERRLGASNFLEMAREIANSHHERWDGAGYPKGLAGEEIPLAARIVAIADVYDALSVRRVYKEPFSHRQCVSIIREEAAGQFDPGLVRVFLDIETQFKEIAGRFADEHPLADEAPQQGAWRSGGLSADQEQALLEALAECGQSTGPSHLLETRS